MITIKIALDGEVLNFLFYDVAYSFSFQTLQQLIQQSFDHKLKGKSFEIFWMPHEMPSSSSSSSSAPQICISSQLDLSIVLNSAKPTESILFYVQTVNDSIAMMAPSSSPKSVFQSHATKSSPDNTSTPTAGTANTIYINLCKVNQYYYSTLLKKNLFSFDHEDTMIQQKRPRLCSSSNIMEEGEDMSRLVSNACPKDARRNMDCWDFSPSAIPFPCKASDNVHGSLDLPFDDFLLPPPDSGLDTTLDTQLGEEEEEADSWSTDSPTHRSVCAVFIEEEDIDCSAYDDDLHLPLGMTMTMTMMDYEDEEEDMLYENSQLSASAVEDSIDDYLYHQHQQQCQQQQQHGLIEEDCYEYDLMHSHHLSSHYHPQQSVL